MICKKCGLEVGETSQFCPHCGTNVKEVGLSSNNIYQENDLKHDNFGQGNNFQTLAQNMQVKPSGSTFIFCRVINYHSSFCT